MKETKSDHDAFMKIREKIRLTQQGLPGGFKKNPSRNRANKPTTKPLQQNGYYQS